MNLKPKQESQSLVVKALKETQGKTPRQVAIAMLKALNGIKK
jgi:hypothetical protein